MGQDHRPQVGGADLEDIHVVHGGVAAEPGVVEDRLGLPPSLHAKEQGEPVLGPQLILLGPLIGERRSAGGLRACHQHVDERVDEYGHVGYVYRHRRCLLHRPASLDGSMLSPAPLTAQDRPLERPQTARLWCVGSSTSAGRSPGHELRSPNDLWPIPSCAPGESRSSWPARARSSPRGTPPPWRRPVRAESSLSIRATRKPSDAAAGTTPGTTEQTRRWTWHRNGLERTEVDEVARDRPRRLERVT